MTLFPDAPTESRKIPLERLVRYVIPEELFEQLVVKQVNVGGIGLLTTTTPIAHVSAVNDALLTARSASGMFRNDRAHFGFSAPFFHYLVANHLQANPESWKRFYVRPIDAKEYGEDVGVAHRGGTWQFHDDKLTILVSIEEEVMVDLFCPLELPPVPEVGDEDLFMMLPVTGTWIVGEA